MEEYAFYNLYQMYSTWFVCHISISYLNSFQSCVQPTNISSEVKFGKQQTRHDKIDFRILQS